MYYSYKSSYDSSKSHSHKSSAFSQSLSNPTFSNPNKNSILAFDLTISFCQKPPQTYKANKQLNQYDMKKLTQVKQKALNLINSIKLGNNCELTESSNLEQQDCEKLMNFIIGGYVDNDFNEYLSVKEFNEKKDDFEVLNDIYEEKLKEWVMQKGRELNKHKDPTSGMKMRSLLAMIYLNENLNKITRMKIQEHMKKNKMVW